ncbi:ABC transporter permease [Porphyromonadaceae bacterium]
MKWYIFLTIAYRALMRNKTRAFLTMLGIIIGISSVITMVSLGSASTQNIRNEISSSGSNMIFIMPGSQNRGGINMGSTSAKSLTIDDVEAIKQQAKYVLDVSAAVSTAGQLVNGTNNKPSTLQGVDIPFFSIRKIELERGTLFSDYDVKTAGKVCLIGKTVVDKLFPDGSDPIGATIRFGTIPLKVIGILEEKGQNAMGQDQDDVVYLPYTTVQKRILAITHVQSIYASAQSEELSNVAVEELTSILRRTHKLSPTAEADLDIRTQAEMLSMISNVTGMLTLLLSAIAGISLLVGGIGIMNIMYVTVTERTREIGLRMSIGAPNSSILMQFLVESIILSLIGGLIGIVLGVGISYVASQLLMWPFIISSGAIALAFFVCAATGVFFGWYPARKASQLDPIVALRYE